MIEISNFSLLDGEDVILDNINLTLTMPFRIGLVGQSGSGKSSLAKALAMLTNDKLKTLGSLCYGDYDLLTLSEAKKRYLRRYHLKYLVQEPFLALNPYLKIKTQLSEVFDEKPSREHLLKALEFVELSQPRILDVYPHQLSGGQRQRLALVQALLSNPSVLIADEPTTALDPILQKQILKLIKDFLEKNESSLLFVSHDIKATLAMTDHILVMKDGRIIESLPSCDFLQRASHPYTKRLLESMLTAKQTLKQKKLESVLL